MSEVAVRDLRVEPYIRRPDKVEEPKEPNGPNGPNGPLVGTNIQSLKRNK